MTNTNTPRADARAAFKRFYDGAPCKGGHGTQRYTATGQCPKCVYERKRKWLDNPENRAKRNAAAIKREKARDEAKFVFASGSAEALQAEPDERRFVDITLEENSDE